MMNKPPPKHPFASGGMSKLNLVARADDPLPKAPAGPQPPAEAPRPPPELKLAPPANIPGVGREAERAAQPEDLKLGSQGDEVAALQDALAEWGFDPGEFDGCYRGGTQQAVEAMQRVLGVPVTGQVDATTRQAQRTDLEAGEQSVLAQNGQAMAMALGDVPGQGGAGANPDTSTDQPAEGLSTATKAVLGVVVLGAAIGLGAWLSGKSDSFVEEGFDGSEEEEPEEAPEPAAEKPKKKRKPRKKKAKVAAPAPASAPAAPAAP